MVEQTTTRDYALIFDGLPYEALEMIRTRLRLPRNQFLDAPYLTMTEHDFCAADAIVALSGSPLPEARAAVEAIFGRPVTVCPPCLSGAHILPPATTPPAAPRAVALAPNPRLPTTPSFQRYELLRPPGITVQSYLTRVGVGRGRRDLREWVREGSVVVLEARP